MARGYRYHTTIDNKDDSKARIADNEDSATGERGIKEKHLGQRELRSLYERVCMVEKDG